MSPTGAPTEVVNVDAHKSRGPVDGVIEPLKTDDIMKNYNNLLMDPQTQHKCAFIVLKTHHCFKGRYSGRWKM